MTTDSLPDDVDPALWFQCDVLPSTRDYVFDAQWHTHPGRMAAYCAARRLDYRISPSELPEALPDATRYWVQGFLAGNLPRQPDVDADDDARLVDWQAKAKGFRVSGRWPAET